jgi:hypothetical protein
VKLGRPRTALPDDYKERVAKWRVDTGGKGYRKLAEILVLNNPGIAFRVAKQLEGSAIPRMTRESL